MTARAELSPCLLKHSASAEGMLGGSELRKRSSASTARYDQVRLEASPRLWVAHPRRSSLTDDPVGAGAGWAFK